MRDLEKVEKKGKFHVGMTNTTHHIPSTFCCGVAPSTRVHHLHIQLTVRMTQSRGCDFFFKICRTDDPNGAAFDPSRSCTASLKLPSAQAAKLPGRPEARASNVRGTDFGRSTEGREKGVTTEKGNNVDFIFITLYEVRLKRTIFSHDHLSLSVLEKSD